jgi:RNA polymerase sigma factor (sigma-70 family)
MITIMAERMSSPTTRYTLLSRLKNWGDDDSWRSFFDKYWRLIYHMALKSGLNEADARDVVQETVMTVARDINKFKRDRKLGSFKGWLRNIVRWRIADELRKRGSRLPAFSSEAPDAEAAINNSLDSPFESSWETEWQKNLLSAAIERVKREVNEEQFQIFDLYVLKETPVADVAKRLGISHARIYLAKHRVSRLMEKHIRNLEKELF